MVGGTAPLELYRVEYAGYSIEVRRDRTGVKAAHAWIRQRKDEEARALRVDRIRRQLLALASDMETAGGCGDRLREAAAMLNLDSAEWRGTDDDQR
jgi:hypothetical protein